MFNKFTKHELNQWLHIAMVASAIYFSYVGKPVSAVILLLTAIWAEVDEINNK